MGGLEVTAMPMSATLSLLHVSANISGDMYTDNESTEVHNPRRDCAILTLAHETHQSSTV